MRADLLVVGAGIVGLACARALQRRWPTARLVVIDKEAGVARQQSGHNSGVLHSGIYYAPGSRKAQLCREGRRRMVEFCEAKGIAHHVSGKVIVARGLQEVARLERLEERGRANGLVGLERLNSEGLGKREPEVVADAALWVPEAGVVDFRDVCEALREELHGQGAEIALDWRVTSIEREKDFLRLRNARGETWETRSLLNCAGLQSDRVAQASGASIDLRVIPFRGEYWRLSESAAARVRGLIYPVPDPELPFLGVHLTRDIHGRVDAGPNAVLAFAREGYRARDVEWRHLAQTLGYPG